jgi:hypothetical protein
MEKFNANVWDDNIPDGAALRRREDKAASNIDSPNYIIKTGGPEASNDPTNNTLTAEQIAAADRILGKAANELSINEDYKPARESLTDSDPNGVSGRQAARINEVYNNNAGDNAQLINAREKLTDALPNADLNTVTYDTSRAVSPNRNSGNYIPPIQTRNSGPKPWDKPAPEKGFFAKLFGG